MGRSDSMEKPAVDLRGMIPESTQVLMLEDLSDGQHNIDLDVMLGQQVARHEQPPLIRIWRSAAQEGIAVSRKDVASKEGHAAMETLMAEGLDVVVRQTGGTAVPQGPGVLHISFLLPRRRESTTTDAYYRLLCLPLIDWLKGFGLQAETGALAGSYCDGTYNVLVNHRKLVGTAQAWRGGLAGMASRYPGYILAHANLVVEYDLTVAAERINRFYSLAHQDYRVAEQASTSLTREVSGLYGMVPAGEKARLAGLDLAHYYREFFAIQ